MVEASLHSVAAFGNIGVGVGDGEDDAADDAIGRATGSTREATPTLPERFDFEAMFPLKLGSIRSFVKSSQIFDRAVDGASDSDSSGCGVSHLSYLVDQALDEWKTQLVLSIEPLAHAANARLKRESGYIQVMRNLSLVCYKLPSMGITEVRFIHWQSSGKTGRPISLDDSNRVKALVCVGDLREPLNLSDSQIIHPDVGIAMLRARGYRYQERPAMPPTMLRLQMMCDVALHSQNQGDDGNGDNHDHIDEDVLCLLCKLRVVNFPFPSSLSQGICYQCPICLQQLKQPSFYVLFCL